MLRDIREFDPVHDDKVPREKRKDLEADEKTRLLGCGKALGDWTIVRIKSFCASRKARFYLYP